MTGLLVLWWLEKMVFYFGVFVLGCWLGNKLFNAIDKWIG